MHVESIPPHPHSRPNDLSVNCSFSNDSHLDQVHLSMSLEIDPIVQSMNYQVRFSMDMDLMISTIFPDLASGWIVSCCHRHRHIYHAIHSQTISTTTVPSLILPGYSAHRSMRLRGLFTSYLCVNHMHIYPDLTNFPRQIDHDLFVDSALT